MVDGELNVYLIDFGFARIGSQEVGGSSVFKGTAGFIPPEQMFEPMKATDLYAVGVAVGRIVEVVDWAVSVVVFGAMGRAVFGAMDWVIDLVKDSFTIVLILLILEFGASVGTRIIAGFLNPLVLLALTVSSLSALSILLYSSLKRRRLITKYRQSEESLIKP